MTRKRISNVVGLIYLAAALIMCDRADWQWALVQLALAGTAFANAGAKA